MPFTQFCSITGAMRRRIFSAASMRRPLNEHIFGSLIVLDQYAKRLKTSVPNEVRKGWLILFRSTLHKYGLAFILRGLRRSFTPTKPPKHRSSTAPSRRLKKNYDPTTPG